jgi:hypothetical protein
MSKSFCGSIFFKNEFWVGLGFKNHAEQKTYLSINHKGKASINDFIIQARKFRKLISFFIGQKVRLKRLICYSSDIVVKIINPSKDYIPSEEPIELFFDDNETYLELPEHLIYYINFADIENDFEPIIKKWYSMLEASLGPVSDLLLQGIAKQNFFEESDFIRAWQGVESFHRIVIQDTDALKSEFSVWFNELKELTKDKSFFGEIKMRLSHAYETSARQRLKQVLDRNLDVLGLKPAKETKLFWIDEILESRNYLTHLDPEGVSKKADMQHLYNYTGLLKALLAVMMFRELGIHEDILKGVGKHSSFNLRTLSDMRVR